MVVWTSVAARALGSGVRTLGVGLVDRCESSVGSSVSSDSGETLCCVMGSGVGMSVGGMCVVGLVMVLMIVWYHYRWRLGFCWMGEGAVVLMTCCRHRWQRR